MLEAAGINRGTDDDIGLKTAQLRANQPLNRKLPVGSSLSTDAVA